MNRWSPTAWLEFKQNTYFTIKCNLLYKHTVWQEIWRVTYCTWNEFDYHKRQGHDHPPSKVIPAEIVRYQKGQLFFNQIHVDIYNRFSDSQVWQRVSDQGESRSVKGWRWHQLCACLPSCLAVIAPDVTRANRGAVCPSAIRKSVKRKADSTTGGLTGSPNKSRCWFIYRQSSETVAPAGCRGKKKRIRDGHPECLCAGWPVWYNSPLHF